ncbi:hypothetical protein FSHL1_004208 [Fusarium sambucinum]
MVRIAPFAVEQWMYNYETTAGVLNVAETLQALSIQASNSPMAVFLARVHCGNELQLIAVARALNLPLRILLLPKVQCANFLSLYSLLEPGDHVVCVYPTYQQLYDVPRSIGAEVTLWKLKEEQNFVPNTDDLMNLIQDNTKMIIINNPNNPTGVPIPDSVLNSIAQIAKEKGVIIFSDEVYRPLFHGGTSGQIQVPQPATALGYEKSIVTGPMSKGYALAGNRLGWIASRDKSIMSTIMAARDYTTISVSQIDDQIARYALSPAVSPSLVDRSLNLARTNSRLVKEFVEGYKSVCSWVEPTAGTTAFVRFNNKNGETVNDVDFCLDLLRKNNVLLVAGSKWFGDNKDFKGYVRMRYVCETDVLAEGLKRLGTYIESNLL